MKKIKSLLLLLLCGLMAAPVFTSCSDDDDNWQEGSKVVLPSQHRAYILTEGSFGKNNSHLTYLNLDDYTTYAQDIFEAQNGLKLGDTANDMIAVGDNVYIVVDGSKYLVRLNGLGIEQARYSDFSTLGEPRSICRGRSDLYVTCYGGYVARFDAQTLALKGQVLVDANPEQIVYQDGKLYTVCSGYGTGNTLCIIDENSFDKAESVTTLDNPYGVQADNGTLYILAYGFDYSNPVGVYDPATKTTTQIGTTTRALATGGRLYMFNSTSADWVHYTTTLSVYEAQSKATTTVDIPSALADKVIYMVEQNPEDGTFFVGTTDYYSNGQIYHLGTGMSTLLSASPIDAGGINPNSMVFMR